MRKTPWLWAGMGLMLVAMPLAAQVPGGPARPGGPMMAAPMRGPGAEFLLASTGPLHLTDQQVTRLAAIARRSAARREGMRAGLDSMRLQATRVRPDSGAPRPAARAGALLQTFQQARDQEHADLRDALAVLTPDQLATAFEMVSRRGMGAGRAGLQMRGAAMQLRARAMRMAPGMNRVPRPATPVPPAAPAPPPAR